MRYLFYMGHPAHFHLFKNVIAELQQQHDLFVVCKTKDMLIDLLNRADVNYFNILTEGRGDGKVGIAWGLAKREWRMLRFCLRHKPDLLIGTSVEITHVGKLLGIPSIVVNEDDVDVVPLFAKIAYPFASAILAPQRCDLGQWRDKGCPYAGYQKLAYLHPNRFTPDHAKVAPLFAGRERYFVLRFVKLAAHHDVGIDGIENETALQLVNQLLPHGQVWISAERDLAPALQPYRLQIDPLDIHHVLSFATLFISDSQSMTVESAMLGTPSIRVSSFVGRISVLEELEHQYQLTIGVQPSERERLFATVEQLLSHDDLHTIWQARRNVMLDNVVDVSAFFAWFIENYPHSQQMLQNDPSMWARAAKRGNNA